MTPLKVRKVDIRHDEQGCLLTLTYDNGEVVGMQTFSDGIGNIYTRTSFTRQGTSRAEEIVTTQGDGIHRMVARGIRALI